MDYHRPQHAVIAALLQSMKAEFLETSKCFFGGGTAIVMANGEYRLSLDVDFLCADADGYREIRSAVRKNGVTALFGVGTDTLRDFRADQYGVRAVLKHQGQPVKFEIVRESRIELSGSPSSQLGVPVLDINSQFSEKLLGNADPCFDRAVAYRDAIDLGFLVHAHGEIPIEAIERAEKAYSRDDIVDALAGALERLAQLKEVQMAAQTLQMRLDDVRLAADAVRCAAHDAWPDVSAFASSQKGDQAPEFG